MTTADSPGSPGSRDDDYIQAFMNHPAPAFERAALVVVDMQYATGHRDGALGRRLAAEGSNVAGYRFDRIESMVVPNVSRLLQHFRAGAGAVLYLTVGAGKADCTDAPPHMKGMFQALDNFEGSREHEIIDELKPQPDESVINKTTIGAFASTGIDHLLRSLGRDQLYMTGVSTNMCVDTTAREAADRGYGVTLIEDACATTHEDLHNATITNFQRLFGRVISTDEAMAELRGEPQSDE
ncbi:MAG: isochorismatase family cysteine hydrolase [Alphaproteobacteria bacterium]|jgi:nicotinamidase-related amidase|nr:isochorismatase family cysteine hydrolase [Alphaproteobacteria bacterium]